MNNSPGKPERNLLYTVYFIYFFCGLTLCFEGSFLPEFKELFQLNYQEQMYTVFAKNIPFALAVLIGYCIPRLGYKNCLSLAMFLFAAGTMLLAPGLASGQYEIILTGFFMIGLGFNFQLVAGNPLLSGLGPSPSSSSRLNFGNALGAIAQIIAPITLTFIIPASMVTVQDKLPYMKGLFIGIGVVLAAVGLLTLQLKKVDLSSGITSSQLETEPESSRSSIWREPKVLLGFITIFLVLGAEAGLFGFYRNFLEDPQIAQFTSHQSYQMFTLYFAVFAMGRVLGGWIQKRVRPATTLVVSAAAAILLLSVAMLAKGLLAVLALTAIGLFVSVFFPTLYALSIEGLGRQTAQASGLLTMGFLGCAVLPVVQGWLADHFSLQSSFVICLAAYGCVLLYSWKGWAHPHPVASQSHALKQG